MKWKWFSIDCSMQNNFLRLISSTMASWTALEKPSQSKDLLFMLEHAVFQEIAGMASFHANCVCLVGLKFFPLFGEQLT